jgi:hypothetical protein
VIQYLLPIVLLALPVLVVVVLALAFGRKLSGSCGGVGPDGGCTRCGKQIDPQQVGVAQKPCG